MAIGIMKLVVLLVAAVVVIVDGSHVSCTTGTREFSQQEYNSTQCHAPPIPETEFRILNNTLKYCTEFSNFACCTPMHEAMLKSSLVQLLGVLGNGACYSYLRLLYCSWLCSACSSRAANWTRSAPESSIWNVTMRVSASFARQMLVACGGICYSSYAGGGPSTFAQMSQGNLSIFMNSFSSGETPLYAPSSVAPNVFFEVVRDHSSPLGVFNGTTPEVLPKIGIDDVGCDQSCSQGTPNTFRSLPWCEEYSSPETSCCLETTEKALSSEVAARAANVYGNDCCYSNLRYLYCAWLCSPSNIDYVDWTGRPGHSNSTMYVSSQTATDFWNSCRDHPNVYKVAKCTEVGEMYPTPEQLLRTLNTANYASYVAGPGKPTLYFVIGEHPATHKSCVLNMLKACKNDLATCSHNTTEVIETTVPQKISSGVIAIIVIASIMSSMAIVGVLACVSVTIVKLRRGSRDTNSMQTLASVVPIYSVSVSADGPPVYTISQSGMDILMSPLGVAPPLDPPPPPPQLPHAVPTAIITSMHSSPGSDSPRTMDYRPPSLVNSCSTLITTPPSP